MKANGESAVKIKKGIILLGIFFIWGLCSQGPQAKAEQAVFHAYSKPLALPEIALEDLDGKMVKIQDQQGKVILLNFWATW